MRRRRWSKRNSIRFGSRSRRRWKKNKKTFADENTTEEAARAEYRQIADRRVRLSLVLSEIGEKNKISVTDDEINRAVISRARQTPGREKEIWDFYRKTPSPGPDSCARFMKTRWWISFSNSPTSRKRSVTREELFKDHEAHSTRDLTGRALGSVPRRIIKGIGWIRRRDAVPSGHLLRIG